MARRCDITGKGVLTGNLVSHSNRKTRTRFLPNIKRLSFISEATGKTYSLAVCISTLRTIESHGGLDGFLMKTSSAKLTEVAKKIKKEIVSKLAEQA
ncbi:MAG: 50S ribosomal protein L28 [Alphaproteobacteria bacterium]|nr:50S ribosomal protein L28 [Alphaproteobacteria bacterium]OJV13117.1 MAG: 50S ribosomal protein L28 [Alphaproteobacteria bacterium 33-17]